MLIAGMLSALPAIVINSTLFPISINLLGVDDPMNSNLGIFLSYGIETFILGFLDDSGSPRLKPYSVWFRFRRTHF